MNERQERPVSGPDALTMSMLLLALTTVAVFKLLGLDGISAGLAVALAIASCLAARPRTLVYWAVGLFFVVPFHYIAVPEALHLFSPPVLLLILAAAKVRVPRDGARRRTSTTVGALFLSTYLVLIALVSPVGSTAHVLAWTALFLIAIVFVPTRLAGLNLFPSLVRIMILVAALLGAFAVAEYALEWNPLASIYRASPDELDQKWGVYRVMTSLGHPLLNGTVFAVLFVVVAARLIQSPSGAKFVALPLAGAGVILTASRSAFVAAALGLTIALVLTVLKRRGTRTWFRAATVGVLAVLAVAAVIPATNLAERSTSAEAEASVSLRLQYVALISDLLKATDYLGGGVGSSSAVLSEAGGYLASLPLESGAMQVVASFGILGTGGLIWVLASMIVPSIMRGAVLAPSAFATYCIAGSGFNLFEAYPGYILMPSLLLGLTLMEACQGDLAQTQRQALRARGSAESTREEATA